MAKEKTNLMINKVNDFIDDWVDTVFKDIKVEFTESNVVKTLIYENKRYVWELYNDYTIIIIAFNDLDYTFYCKVSFKIPDPIEKEGFYHSAVTEITFDEMVDFIKECYQNNRKEIEKVC